MDTSLEKISEDALWDLIQKWARETLLLKKMKGEPELQKELEAIAEGTCLGTVDFQLLITVMRPVLPEVDSTMALLERIRSLLIKKQGAWIYNELWPKPSPF